MSHASLSSVVHIARIDWRQPPMPDLNPLVSLWICLRGSITIESTDGPFLLHRKQFLTLPAEHRPALVPGSAGLGLLIAMPASHLTPSLRTRISRRHASPGVFAHAAMADRALIAAAIRMLRQPNDPKAGHDAALALQVMRLALAGQHELRTWLARAPGRSESHRRHSLARLLRARNTITNLPFESHDLDTLAHAANYSKSHFLRTFRDVFGDTPGSLLTSSRVAMAKTLMSDSGMGIAEIAADVGYGSRCAFSRMFKHHVGQTATNFRKTLARGMAANTPATQWM